MMTQNKIYLSSFITLYILFLHSTLWCWNALVIYGESIGHFECEWTVCRKWHMTREADPGFQSGFSGSPARAITSFPPALFGPPSQTPVCLSTEVRHRVSSEQRLTAPAQMESYTAQDWMEDLGKSVQHWRDTIGNHHGPWKGLVQIPENPADYDDDVQIG